MAELGAMAPRAPGFKLFMGASTGMSGVTDYGLLRDLFQAAALTKRPVVVHAEDESILRRSQQALPQATARDHHHARPAEAEAVAVAAAIELAAATGAPLHVFHVSTGRGAELVAEARRGGLDVSASTSPHYLLLTHEDSERLGNFLKVNPSVKSAKDREKLLELFAEGSLEAIGTDHAPHPLDEKRRPYAEAPSGLPSVDLVLPLLFAIHDKGVPLPRVLDSMTVAAAKCFGVQGKGRIAAGFDADLVLVDPAAERVVKGSELPSTSKWTPYEGLTLRGFPRAVYRRGERVFDGRTPAAGAGGRRVVLAPVSP
jgi:dihydroorotase